jgi:hypothetical protein
VNYLAMEKDARLFTYKVAHDGGSAPNPYHGICTLAICKSAIRRVAKQGDVVAGLACAPDERRIIYCMVVDHVMPWAEYILACRGAVDLPPGVRAQSLARKIPHKSSDTGDCIWPQASRFADAIESVSGHEGHLDWERDVVSGRNVLLSARYWYFGKGDQHAIEVEDRLAEIIPGRGHRSDANRNFRAAFADFFNRQLQVRKVSSYGKHGMPALNPEQNDAEGARCRTRERDFDLAGEESAATQRRSCSP